MNFENLETYKGLIKLNNISELGFLKKSCAVKFFEDATYFTKAILKNTTIDSEVYLETEFFDISVYEYMTVYVTTNISLLSNNKIELTHKLFLLNQNHNNDDEILSDTRLILNCNNIDKLPKDNTKNLSGIYSAFKDLVRLEDCDQMSHMNVQFYFGKHSEAIKCLFNKINSYSSDKINYKILNERPAVRPARRSVRPVPDLPRDPTLEHAVWHGGLGRAALMGGKQKHTALEPQSGLRWNIRTAPSLSRPQSRFRLGFSADYRRDNHHVWCWLAGRSVEGCRAMLVTHRQTCCRVAGHAGWPAFPDAIGSPSTDVLPPPRHPAPHQVPAHQTE